MKVKFKTEPLEVGTKVKLLVSSEAGLYDLLRGEVVAVFPHETDLCKYRILGETSTQTDVVAHALHTNDTLSLFLEVEANTP